LRWPQSGRGEHSAVPDQANEPPRLRHGGQHIPASLASNLPVEDRRKDHGGERECECELHCRRDRTLALPDRQIHHRGGQGYGTPDKHTNQWRNPIPVRLNRMGFTIRFGNLIAQHTDCTEQLESVTGMPFEGLIAGLNQLESSVVEAILSTGEDNPPVYRIRRTYVQQ